MQKNRELYTHQFNHYNFLKCISRLQNFVQFQAIEVDIYQSQNFRKYNIAALLLRDRNRNLISTNLYQATTKELFIEFCALFLEQERPKNCHRRTHYYSLKIIKPCSEYPKKILIHQKLDVENFREFFIFFL